MPADHNLSVEEILAACRKADGGGDDSGSSTSAADSGPSVEPEALATPPAAAQKPPGKMSPAEVLAAARAEKGGQKAAASQPASAAQAAGGKKASEMSVAEMLAAARAEKAEGGKPAAKAAPKPSGKPAAKSSTGTAAKTAAKAAPKPKPSGPKDTASILAAARGAAKPGPITKAEAAARAQQTPPKTKEKPSVPPMPERPAYAQTRPAPTATDAEDRRGFLATLTGVFVGSSLAVGFSSLAVTHLLWLLGTARFMFPNILTEPPTQFKVGFPDELAPGQVETKYKAEFGVWVVRFEYNGQPQIYAIESVCTHLGCTPNWLEGEQKFKCPCHGSGFYKDGINFEGPAPRPLERFAIRLADDGQLEVDKSRKFKEEIGQWKDSASFVPV